MLEHKTEQLRQADTLTLDRDPRIEDLGNQLHRFQGEAEQAFARLNDSDNQAEGYIARIDELEQELEIGMRRQQKSVSH